MVSKHKIRKNKKSKKKRNNIQKGGSDISLKSTKKTKSEKKKNTEESNKNDSICSICLEHLEKNLPEKSKTKTKKRKPKFHVCHSKNKKKEQRHYFHKECWTQYQISNNNYKKNIKCPLCNTPCNQKTVKNKTDKFLELVCSKLSKYAKCTIKSRNRLQPEPEEENTSRTYIRDYSSYQEQRRIRRETNRRMGEFWEPEESSNNNLHSIREVSFTSNRSSIIPNSERAVMRQTRRYR